LSSSFSPEFKSTQSYGGSLALKAVDEYLKGFLGIVAST
jgi:hypothetical protein